MVGCCTVIRRVRSMGNLFGVSRSRLNNVKPKGESVPGESTNWTSRLLRVCSRCSSALAARRLTTNKSTASGSSLLSVNMGLSITPYQLRTVQMPTNVDLNQRFRRLHMRAPLRPLITLATSESTPQLEVHAHRLVRSSDDERQRAAVAPTTPTLVDNVRHVNIEFGHELNTNSGIVGQRFLTRRRSHDK
jgi:hypothetical protein